MKEWSRSQNHYHLNGWFHDKDIPSSPEDLIKEYNQLVGDNLVDHFVLDPAGMDHKILQASLDWAEDRGSRIHMIQDGTDILIKKLDKRDRFGPFAAVRLSQNHYQKEIFFSKKYLTFPFINCLFYYTLVVLPDWYFNKTHK